MSAVRAVPGGAGAVAPKGVMVAPAAAAGVRAPSTRIDFRSLLREDALVREPAAPRSTAASPLVVAAAPSLPLAPSRASSPFPHPFDATDVRAAAHGPVRDEDVLDPFARHHASLTSSEAILAPAPGGLAIAPAPLAPAVVAAEVPSTRASASLEDLMPALVRRVAYSGDGRRGTMRLELGAGRLAGSTLLVHAEGGRVRVHLEVAPGLDGSGWRERIEERLGSRGIATDTVEVT